LAEVFDELKAIQLPDVEKKTSWREGPAGDGLPRLIEKLLSLVETGNTESLKYFDTIKEVFSPAAGEALVEELENFEFEKARTILLSVKEELNGEGK
jgi:hypothetical protein